MFAQFRNCISSRTFHFGGRSLLFTFSPIVKLKILAHFAHFLRQALCSQKRFCHCEVDQFLLKVISNFSAPISQLSICRQLILFRKPSGLKYGKREKRQKNAISARSFPAPSRQPGGGEKRFSHGAKALILANQLSGFGFN